MSFYTIAFLHQLPLTRKFFLHNNTFSQKCQHLRLRCLTFVVTIYLGRRSSFSSKSIQFIISERLFIALATGLLCMCLKLSHDSSESVFTKIELCHVCYAKCHQCCIISKYRANCTSFTGSCRFNADFAVSCGAYDSSISSLLIHFR